MIKGKDSGREFREAGSRRKSERHKDLGAEIPTVHESAFPRIQLYKEVSFISFSRTCWPDGE